MAGESITQLRFTDNSEKFGEEVSFEHFGGVFVGFRKLDRFSDIADASGLNLIRWPGGAAGEQAGWYGLEYENLVEAENPKSGLSEVASYAAEQGATLSIVIPTGEYANDLDRAREDIQHFLEHLADGFLGTLPERLILEIGNEYYAIPEFIEEPHLYGQVASAFVDQINTFKAEHPSAFPQTTLETAIQIGRLEADNDAIINALNENLTDAVDHLVLHRFPWGLDDADNMVDYYKTAIEAWSDAGAASDISILMSEWNVASWTRLEARNTFIELQAEQFGINISLSEADLDSRSHTEFETFWQHGTIVSPSGEVADTKFGLSKRDYGLAQASGLMEVFSAGLEVGVDLASLYGVDTPYAASIAFGNERFVGADMLRLMSESLPGTRRLDIDVDNQRDDQINIWAFASDTKAVFYFSVDELDEESGPLNKKIDLSELGYDAGYASIRTLTSVLRETWMSDHNVVDNHNVDETPEGRLYEQGVVSQVEPVLVGGNLELSFDVSFQIIEVTIPLDLDDGDEAEPVAAHESELIDALIFGSDKDDIIHGTDGDDILQSFGGDDTLIGGDGDDVFILDAQAHGIDEILDYAGVAVDLDSGIISGDALLIQESAGAQIHILGADVALSGAIVRDASSENLMVSFLNYPTEVSHWNTPFLSSAEISSEHLITKIFDLGNNETFSEIEVTFASNGSAREFNVLNDDGSRSVISFDRLNEHEWERHEEIFDQLGQLIERNEHDEAGGTTKTVFDPTFSRDWENFMRHFDSEGELKEQFVTYDQGNSQRSIYDTSSEEFWHFIREDRNSEGELYDKRVVYDSGRELRTILDVDQSNIWSNIQEYRDTNGLLFDKRFNYDNGTSQRIILDVEEEDTWDTIFEFRNADGSLFDKRTIYDDGSQTRFVIDVDGESWETIRENTSSDGELYEKITLHDNGYSTRLIIDSENTHTWSQIVETRNPDGDMLKKSTSYDNKQLQILLFELKEGSDWDVHTRIFNSENEMIYENFE